MVNTRKDVKNKNLYADSIGFTSAFDEYLRLRCASGCDVDVEKKYVHDLLVRHNCWSYNNSKVFKRYVTKCLLFSKGCPGVVSFTASGRILRCCH